MDRCRATVVRTCNGKRVDVVGFSVQDSPVPHGSLVEVPADCSPQLQPAHQPSNKWSRIVLPQSSKRPPLASWPNQVVTLTGHVPSVTCSEGRRGSSDS